MRWPGLFALATLSCGLGTTSLGGAEHLSVTVFASGDHGAPELDVDLDNPYHDCVVLTDEARATFDDAALSIREHGEVVGSVGDSQDCRGPEFDLPLPQATDSGVPHVLTIEDDGRTVVVELPHYLQRPTLALSSTLVRPGETLTAGWEPSDIDLSYLNESPGTTDCLFAPPIYFVQNGDHCASARFEKNVATIVVPSALDAGTAALLFFDNPAPAAPVSRCQGAESCFAWQPYFPDPVELEIGAGAPP